MLHLIPCFEFDSLFAGLAIGPALKWQDKIRLAAAFGAFDAAAALLGSMWTPGFPELPFSAAYLIGAFLLARAARGRMYLLYSLAAVLGVDNLFSGVKASTVPALAILSATMMLLGSSLATIVRRALFPAVPEP